MPSHAIVRMQAITLVRGAQSELVVHISIECDLCGGCDLIFAGHHVRPIVEVLTELLASDPVGTEGGVVQEVLRHSHEIHPQEN